MPYIIKSERPELETSARYLGFKCLNDGQLNFVISIILIEYAKKKDLNYQSLKDTWTTAIDAGLEFRERVQREYENIKIENNGDIYGQLIKAIKSSGNK